MSDRAQDWKQTEGVTDSQRSGVRAPLIVPSSYSTRAISVCALVPYPLNTSPSQRFRIEQWRPYLAQHGIEVDLIPFVDAQLMRVLHQPGHLATKSWGMVAAFGRRAVHVATSRRYDAVLIHRAACIAGPAVLERLIARMGRPIIYDFDDAIFSLDTTEANRQFGWLKFPGKTASICRLSNHVVVGNSFLAEYARRFNTQVTIIPSSVDIEHWHPKDRAATNGRIVVGWTGSSTSQTHLETFAPVLRELLENDEGIIVYGNGDSHGLRKCWC